jgi:hypothetical protein
VITRWLEVSKAPKVSSRWLVSTLGSVKEAVEMCLR